MKIIKVQDWRLDNGALLCLVSFILAIFFPLFSSNPMRDVSDSVSFFMVEIVCSGSASSNSIAATLVLNEYKHQN